MKALEKISPSQLFCILLLTHTAAGIIRPENGGCGAAALTAIILAEVVRFALALPIVIFAFRGESFYGAMNKRSRPLAIAAAILAVLLLLGYALSTIMNTAEFVQRNILAGASALLTVAMIAAFAVYLLFSGVQAAARAGVLFLVLAGVVTLTVMLASIPHFRTQQLLPQWQEDEFVSELTYRLMDGGEYLILAALLPHTNNRSHGAGKAALWLALCGTLAAVIICVFCRLTLGEFSAFAEYPFAAASSLADIALIKRLDGITCAVWALAGAFRTGLLLLSAWAAVKAILPQNAVAARKESA